MAVACGDEEFFRRNRQTTRLERDDLGSKFLDPRDGVLVSGPGQHLSDLCRLELVDVHFDSSVNGTG